jgi:hypothetical protein
MLDVVVSLRIGVDVTRWSVWRACLLENNSNARRRDVISKPCWCK